MFDLVARFALPLLVTGVLALLIALYHMVNADREAEEAPFLPQRQAALVRAKAARFAIGALVVIVVELTVIWITSQFRPTSVTRMPTATVRLTPTQVPTATPTLEPTITLTPSPIPPTATPTASPTRTPTATPSATPTPEYLIHVIQSGDTLEAVAARYGTTVAAIEAANPGIDPTLLQIGQEVRIPVAAITPTATP